MPTLQNIAAAVASLGDSPTLFFVLLVVIVALFVLTITVFQLGTRLRHLTYPVYDQVIKEAQKKADQLVKDAAEQARAIRTKAEMEAGKILVERKKADQVLKEEYTKQLSDITNQGKVALESQFESTSRMSGEIVSALKGHADRAESALTEEVNIIKQTLKEERERIHAEFSKLAVHTKEDHGAVIAESKRQIAETLAHEIESVRKSIDEYRKERFEFIDQQVVELVEETARIALNKSLSLEEHMDIIRTSLDEAKQQGIFGK